MGKMGYKRTLQMEPANGWKCVKCVLGTWGRVESKPDFVKWLEMNPVCAWHVGEGMVQT